MSALCEMAETLQDDEPLHRSLDFNMCGRAVPVAEDLRLMDEDRSRGECHDGTA